MSWIRNGASDAAAEERRCGVKFAPGSTFINCTGYAFKQDVVYEPFVSKSGKVVSIQAASRNSSAEHDLGLLGQRTCRTWISCRSCRSMSSTWSVSTAPVPDVLLRHDRLRIRFTNAALMISVLPKPALDGFGAEPRALVSGAAPACSMASAFLRYMKANPDQIRRSLDTVRETLRHSLAACLQHSIARAGRALRAESRWRAWLPSQKGFVLLPARSGRGRAARTRATTRPVPLVISRLPRICSGPVEPGDRFGADRRGLSSMSAWLASGLARGAE